MKRAVGGLVIAMALAAGTIPAALAPTVLAGRPTSIMVAPPPIAGSCVAEDPVLAVDCDALHSAEVTAAWTTIRPDPPGTAYGRCEQAGEQYLAGITDWPGAAWGWIRPAISIQVVRGPDPLPQSGWSWTACLIAPSSPGVTQDGGYRGRISDQRTGRPPAEVRTCFTVTDTGRDDRGRSTVALPHVSCSAAHTGELMGSLAFNRAGADTQAAETSGGAVYTADTDPGRLVRCVELARERTGATDPTYGHRLSVVVRIRLVAETFGPRPTSAATALVRTEYVAICTLEAAGTRRLSRSVLDLGTSPLPLI